MTIGPTPSTARQYCSGKTDFVGLWFDNYTEKQAIENIRLNMKKPGFSYVVTPNVDHIVRFSRSTDPTLAEAYRTADMTLCDSRILNFLARRSGLNLRAVPGSDLTREMLETGSAGWRVAIVGGDPAIHSNLQSLYPNFEWTFFEPPMGLRHNPAARLAIAEFVENASADIIFFAVGAPQSEIICHEIAARGRARGVALCIGASLEFLTGAKQRAPLWMQQMSLEWLYRLGSEPRRLWRRYLIEGPPILLIWWRWHRVRAARLRVESDSKSSVGK
jgi:N-acetylglucosaminyldiphosphoundecaprenol N-acetyl-beta-D-mannosaminyltransferase